MTPVFKGRYTAQIDGPFVVFVIGMRVNQLWAVHKWWPVAAAMGPMLGTLYRHPERGFLGGETFLYWRGICLIQYWRSYEALEAFARNPADPHLAAWRRFNQRIGSDGSVGIWHETYAVAAGRYECVYGNMPRFGLAAAAAHSPISGRHERARDRLGAD
jgi:hypothetical protein